MHFEESSKTVTSTSENRDCEHTGADSSSQNLKSPSASRGALGRLWNWAFSAKWRKSVLWLTLATLILASQGCGTFVADRIAQAPNTYPTWFAPKARVSLGMSHPFAISPTSA